MKLRWNEHSRLLAGHTTRPWTASRTVDRSRGSAVRGTRRSTSRQYTWHGIHSSLSRSPMAVITTASQISPLLSNKVRSTSTPSYLHRLLQDREDVHDLRRRSATPALCRPFTKTTMAKRAFRCTAPAIWNSLPKTVLDSDTVNSFKPGLKTHLFSQAFSHTPTDH